MTTYYMNADVSKYTIIADHNHPSEYQDLIDAYLAKGGKITKCPEGARTTFDSIKSYKLAEGEVLQAKLNKGSALFDEIELSKGREYNQQTNIEDHFDKSEKLQ